MLTNNIISFEQLSPDKWSANVDGVLSLQYSHLTWKHEL